MSISDGKNASGESVVSQTINGLTGTTYVSPLENQMVYIRGQHRLFRVQKVMGLLEILHIKLRMTVATSRKALGLMRRGRLVLIQRVC